MDPRSQRAKKMAMDNLAAIERLIKTLKPPVKEDFYTVKEVDSPKTDLLPHVDRK
jgi:hypothetical protein